MNATALPAFMRRADERTARRNLEALFARMAQERLEEPPEPKLSDAVEAELGELRAGPTWKRLEFFLRDEKGERIRLAEIHRSWIEFVERAHAAGLHAG